MFILCLSAGCSHLFYHPSRAYYEFDYFRFFTEDNVALCGRILQSVRRPAKGTIVHFHGNVGNMDSHMSQVKWLTHHGYDVFMFDYRGYGASQGTPHRNGLAMDSRAALRYVLQTRKNVYLFGQSLGGNQALSSMSIGNSHQVNAIVLDATFYSYASVANDFLGGTFLTYPFVWLLIGGNCHSAMCNISSLKTPVLLMHGDRDEVIDIAHSDNLFANIPAQKKLLRVANCKHLQIVHKQEARQALLAFLEKYRR